MAIFVPFISQELFQSGEALYYGLNATSGNQMCIRDRSKLADIEAGKVATVIGKDMSRLGRNYLQVGMYTEMIFPQKGVRFIAINDGVDLSLIHIF